MLSSKARQEVLHCEVARDVVDAEIAGLQALKRVFREDFDLIVEEIAKVQGVVFFSGIGKSGHVARKISATFASTGTPSTFIHPAEAVHGDLGMISKNDIMILMSNSGETSELMPVIDYCKNIGIKIIGIARREKSTLISASDFKVVLPDVAEASAIPTPTTSAVMMMAYGDALSVALYTKKRFTRNDFKVFHPGGNLGMKLLNLQNIMHTGKELPLISLDVKIIDAIITITSKRFGCVGVLNSSGQLVGIVTDGDLRRHITTDFHSTPVGDIMTHDPITLNKEALAVEAMAAMNLKSITSIFVVDESSKPIGIIHVHDLFRIGLS